MDANGKSDFVEPQNLQQFSLDDLLRQRNALRFLLWIVGGFSQKTSCEWKQQSAEAGSLRSPKKIRIDAGDENCACAGPEGGWRLNLLSNVYEIIYFTAKVAQFTRLVLKAQVPNQELSSFSAISTTPAGVSISLLCCLLTNGLQVESLARRKQSTNIARRRPCHRHFITVLEIWKFWLSNVKKYWGFQ